MVNARGCIFSHATNALRSSGSGGPKPVGPEVSVANFSPIACLPRLAHCRDCIAGGAAPSTSLPGPLLHPGLLRREFVDRAAEFAGDDNLVVFHHVGAVLGVEAL